MSHSCLSELLGEPPICSDSESASKYLEQASADYDLSHFFNNAVDCDLQRANITLQKNPLQSLEIFKKVVGKLVKKQQITCARPIVYKIVLLTGSNLSFLQITSVFLSQSVCLYPSGPS